MSWGPQALECAGLRHRSRRPHLVLPSWQQGAPRDLLMGATAGLAREDRNQGGPEPGRPWGRWSRRGEGSPGRPPRPRLPAQLAELRSPAPLSAWVAERETGSFCPLRPSRPVYCNQSCFSAQAGGTFGGSEASTGRVLGWAGQGRGSQPGFRDFTTTSLGPTPEP